MTGFKFLFLNKYSIIKANKYAKDWNFIELGNIESGIFSNGMNKNKEDYGIGCLFVNILDVFREFTVDPKKLKRVKASDEEIKQYSLRKGDLILDRSSNIFETVGYPSYFDGADEPVVFSGFTFRYRPNPKSWNSKFLTCQLMSHSIRKLVISISTKSANSNVNQKSYKKILIPCPPLPEQQKIASILSRVDALIESTQKVIENTKQLKKGLMQQLLTRGIGHKKFKKVPWLFGKEIEIPEEWEKIMQGNVCEFINGYAYSQNEFSNTGYQIIRIQNLTGGSNYVFSNVKLPEKQFAVNGDLLFAWSATFAPFIWRGEKAAFHYHQWKVIPNELSDKMFLFYHFDRVTPIIKNMGQSGLGMFHMTKKGMEKFPFLKPSIKEQTKIASILSGVDAYIQKNQKYKEKLEILKKGLMQKLLTGKIRVTV